MSAPRAVPIMKKLLIAIGLLSLLPAVGCGGGSGVTFPGTTGNFSLASLSGEYVYEIHGAASGIGSYREYGILVADGAGHITSGTDDFTSTSSGGVQSRSVTGTYKVGSDGTGFIFIGPTFLSQSVGVSQVTFAITIVSAAKPSTKVYLMEADTFASGGGISELQSPSANPVAVPAGTFIFRLHETVSAQAAKAAAQVGSISVANATFTGSMDQNLGGTASSVSITSGSFNAPVAGRGTGSFTDSANNTTSFIYYVLDNTRFAILVTNSGAVGAGRAELQSGTAGNGLSGNYAFGSGGDDILNNIPDGVASVGQFSAASGAIAGSEDSVVDGTYSPNLTIASCFTSASNGRVVVTNCSQANSQIFWMVNPSRAFFLNVNSSTVEDGTADLQTSNAFSTSSFSGQYSLVMDGDDVTVLPSLGSLARVGLLQFQSGGKVLLTELANDTLNGSGASNPGTLSGLYQISQNGLIQANLNSGSLDLVGYAVSNSQAYMLQIDTGTVTSGTAELQQ
jgi:hypothetical protein